MEKAREITGYFDIEGNVTDLKPLGAGLINDTFRVYTDEGPGYVLQKINNSIFKDVDLLQSNIESVTSHIRAGLLREGGSDIDRKVLRFITLKDSPKTYWTDGHEYWRMSVYISDSVTYDTVTPEYSYCAGKAFGDFQVRLADLPEKLGETIPDFHNMELRARQLKEAVESDPVGRCAETEVQDILSEINGYVYEMCKAERMYRDGLLPKRICHCDTKVSNMLFDKDSNVLCVIDLDTVMPSFIFSDFGDFMRTAANKVAEDCPDIDSVEFDMDVFKAFTTGYLESASSFLTDVEKENLPYAAALFPFMQAVRFFADYINGDTYYKIKYPDHNLVRTRNQMALFRDVMSHYQEMAEFVKVSIR